MKIRKNKNKRLEKYKKIDFKYNFSVYWDILRNYKGVLVFLLLLIILMELLRISGSFIFKIIIDEGSEFLLGNLSRSGYLSILYIVLGIFAAVFLIRSIFRWIYIHYIARLDSNLARDVKIKFFNHILGLDYKFHTTHKTGSLISRLIRGSSAMEEMSDSILMNFAPLIVQLIVSVISLLYFDIISALIVIATSVLFVSYSYYIQVIQQTAKLEANLAEDIEKGNIADIFTNVESIRYYGKEKLIGKKFDKLTDTTKSKVLRNWNYFRWFDSGQILIMGLGTVLILIFSLIKFLNGEITIGTLAFIYSVYGALISHLFGFVWGIRRFYRAMANFQDLFQYGKLDNEIKDKPGAQDLKISEGEVVFNNIGFNYGNRKMFQNFSLSFPKNKKIALVGHSGCGKTTLVKLLYRLYDVDSGKITIDGKDIRHFKQKSLREEMSIVPQECVLFDDTIYNNIAFSNPKATREEVIAAMKFAQLDKIVNEFPRKERTIVGERGVKLSGGEKQRVSIARAILANKKILVLDEATSSLDSETEYEIQRDLEKLMQGRTSIIIAHRLSTIMHADKIVVMKKGRIVQMGTHNELINQEGEYKKLWNLQKGGYIK